MICLHSIWHLFRFLHFILPNVNGPLLAQHFAALDVTFCPVLLASCLFTTNHRPLVFSSSHYGTSLLSFFTITLKLFLLEYQ